MIVPRGRLVVAFSCVADRRCMHRARRLSRRITATGDCATWRAGFGQLDRTLTHGAHGNSGDAESARADQQGVVAAKARRTKPFFVVFGTKAEGRRLRARRSNETVGGRGCECSSSDSPVCTKGAARVCSLTLSLKATGKDDFVITTHVRPITLRRRDPGDGEAAGCRPRGQENRSERQDVHGRSRWCRCQHVALPLARCSLKHRRDDGGRKMWFAT